MKFQKPLVFPVPEAPRRAAPEAASLEPVLLIHGTWANVQHGGPPDWWRPGSSFCAALDRLLEGHGSAARCWSQLEAGPRGGRRASDAPFAWTGNNMESDRLLAGEALASQLVALEADPRVARYHLVGHSHGGNVILNALAHPLYRPLKLGSVVYMGTPVLKFGHLDRLVERGASLLVAAGVVVACVWGWERWPDQQVYLLLLTAAAVLGFLFGLRALFTAGEDGSGRAAKGRRHAFMFEGSDEAFVALESAEGILRRTTAFLWQWLESEPSQHPAVTPTVATLQTLQARVAAMGPSQAAEALERADAPATSPIGGLAWTASAQPAPSGLLESAVPWVSAMSKSLPLGNLLPTLLRGLAWCAVGLRGAAFALVRLVVGSLSKLLAGLMLGVMFVLLWISLPWFIRRSAFGEDRGVFRAVSSLPPGVDRLEPISAGLVAEAAAVGQGLSHRAGAAVLAGLVRREPLALRTIVKDALSNPALAHSYYYRSDEIITRSAALIAGVAPAPL